VIYSQRLQTLEVAYQEAAASGALNLLQAYELFRVAAVHRPALFEAIQGGKTCSRFVHWPQSWRRRPDNAALRALGRRARRVLPAELARGQRETRH
jgi:hypothetical protein